MREIVDLLTNITNNYINYVYNIKSDIYIDNNNINMVGSVN